jgi:transcriptional regulator
MPWVLDVTDEDSSTELGTLRSHFAKFNPHCKAIVEDIQTRGPSNGSLEQEVCILFNGPIDSYVTPKFYVETKPTTGKVVPTWNYSAVQAYGKATFYFYVKNPDTISFLQKQVENLTKHGEETIMGYTGGENPEAWKVTDAPSIFIEHLMKKITGIEIKIDRLEGKFKMNQEVAKGDRERVV